MKKERKGEGRKEGRESVAVMKKGSKEGRGREGRETDRKEEGRKGGGR